MNWDNEHEIPSGFGFSCDSAELRYETRQNLRFKPIDFALKVC